jgi:hypothetical protein
MLLYLDSRDLIDIVEHGKPVPADVFDQKLRCGGHTLIYSFYSISAIAQPLFSNPASTVVTQLLNRLEDFPHRFIQLPSLDLREVREALDAFAESREYVDLQPFTERFDESLVLDNCGPTRLLLKHGLAESVFELWQTKPAVLKEPSNTERTFCGLIDSDRQERIPGFEDYFVGAYGGVTNAHHLRPRPADFRAFARWVCDNPTRCPSLRLVYEVYYHMVRDKSRPPRPTDLADLTHVMAIPYVDLVTLDRNMRHYAKEALRRTVPQWQARVCEDAREVIAIF